MACPVCDGSGQLLKELCPLCEGSCKGAPPAPAAAEGVVTPTGGSAKRVSFADEGTADMEEGLLADGDKARRAMEELLAEAWRAKREMKDQRGRAQKAEQEVAVLRKEVAMASVREKHLQEKLVPLLLEQRKMAGLFKELQEQYSKEAAAAAAVQAEREALQAELRRVQAELSEIRGCRKEAATVAGELEPAQSAPKAATGGTDREPGAPKAANKRQRKAAAKCAAADANHAADAAPGTDTLGLGGQRPAAKGVPPPGKAASADGPAAAEQLHTAVAKAAVTAACAKSQAAQEAEAKLAARMAESRRLLEQERHGEEQPTSDDEDEEEEVRLREQQRQEDEEREARKAQERAAAEEAAREKARLRALRAEEKRKAAEDKAKQIAEERSKFSPEDFEALQAMRAELRQPEEEESPLEQEDEGEDEEAFLERQVRRAQEEERALKSSVTQVVVKDMVRAMMQLDGIPVLTPEMQEAVKKSQQAKQRAALKEKMQVHRDLQVMMGARPGGRSRR